MILPSSGGRQARNKPTNEKCKRISDSKKENQAEEGHGEEEQLGSDRWSEESREATPGWEPNAKEASVPSSQEPGTRQSAKQMQRWCRGLHSPTHCGDCSEVRVFIHKLIHKRFGSSIQLVTF